MREQLSFFPVLLQVRVAFGATSPGGHFTNSEEKQNAQTHTLDNPRSSECLQRSR